MAQFYQEPDEVCLLDVSSRPGHSQGMPRRQLVSTAPDRAAAQAARGKREVLASLLLIAGGVLKIPLWILFISLHGPTSFNENDTFLGGDPLIWGAVMSAVPSLLVAAGLIGHAQLVGAGIARRVGLLLALSALIIPACVDLISGALWPPLLIPVLAAGAIVIGLTGRRDPGIGGLSIAAFLGIGALLAATFAYMLLIPASVFDAIGGYRLQGIVEHVLVGVGWIGVGVGLLTKRATSQPARTRTARAPGRPGA